jgi:hypothetical protein
MPSANFVAVFVDRFVAIVESQLRGRLTKSSVGHAF